MNADKAQPVLLKDYRPADYNITEVHLDFSLHDTATTVVATLLVAPNPKGQQLRTLLCFKALLTGPSNLKSRRLSTRLRTLASWVCFVPVLYFVPNVRLKDSAALLTFWTGRMSCRSTPLG